MDNSGLISDSELWASHYDFELPKELIAQSPLPNREDARLMLVERTKGRTDHRHVRDLPTLLKSGDCLVLNDTKVIPAKLVGVRTSTRGRWTGLFLESDAQGNWKFLCKTRGKVQPGEKITLEDRHGAPRIEMALIARLDDGCWVGKPLAEGSTEELLQLVGRIPLPHYIRGGNMVDADVADYQTVFAKHPGAVAAPTAGLHFTKPLISRLIDAGVNIVSVTLHVGVGTFRPIAGDRIDEHEMHEEHGSIDARAATMINQTRISGGRVIAVGTTCVRLLETAAADSEELKPELKPWYGATDLYIRPPYAFRVVDAVLTNFHLPRSTLLVLVRTFGGDELIRRAYDEAVRERYRFFSYGDAMLIT